jgi:hypothetical protein
MEKSIGALERVRGHTHDTIYDLLFTTERVIAVIIEHPTDVPLRFGVTELFLGGQLLKQSQRPERMRIAEERRRAYKEKTLDELAVSHRFNFEIRYRVITSLEITRGLFQSRLKFHISGPSIAERTIQFTLTKDQAPKARHLIDQVLSSKIKKK